MTADLFLSLVVFSIAAFYTPGPNNLMLMASGMNFGMRRTLPHLLGVNIGFGAMVAMVGLGLRPVFAAYPQVFSIMRLLGIAFLVYLAWRIATAGSVKDAAAGGRPITFFQAAAFQWVNPKAWGIVFALITAYVPQENFAFNVIVVAMIVPFLGSPASGIWMFFGANLRRWLKTERSRTYFNITMAGLLLASLYPVVREVTGW